MSARRSPLLLWFWPGLAALACAPLRFDPVTSDAGTTDGPGGEADAAVSEPDGRDPAPDVAVDAFPADAPLHPSGPSRCPGDVLVCDGFESASLDGSIWNPFAEPGAALTIDATRAARGLRSVHLHVDARSTEPVGLHTAPIAAAGLPNPVYLRFFLLVPSSLPPFGSAFVSLDNDANQGVSADWDVDSVNLQGANASPEIAGPPRGRWVCLQIKARTGSASELSLFLDGGTVPALSSPLPSPLVLQRVMFAISPDGSAAAPVDMWIDEVVVSRNPVGCED